MTSGTAVAATSGPDDRRPSGENRRRPRRAATAVPRCVPPWHAADAPAGFAIPAAVLVLVVLSMLGLGGLYVAVTNLAADLSVRRGSKALYAAEAGANRVIATWDRAAYGALNPGDSVDTGWQTLPDGSQYRVWVLRVDGGSGTAIYRLRSVGRPAAGATAQRVVLRMVAATLPGAVCCHAALRLQGRLDVAARRTSPDPVRVDGHDYAPPLWGARCPPSGTDVPGVSIRRLRDLSVGRWARVDGAPPVEEDPTIDDATFTNFGTLTYAEIAATADKKFVGNQTFPAILPVTAGGACQRSVPTNWGDPLNPTSPCFDYLPIIHVAGNANILGVGFGQGILLVDGDLVLSGSFEFYGVILVLGNVEVRDDAKVTGGLLVRNGAGGGRRSRVLEDAKVRYSACAVSRALASLALVRPLAGRSWFEVLR